MPLARHAICWMAYSWPGVAVWMPKACRGACGYAVVAVIIAIQALPNDSHAADTEFYESQVKPLLADKCFACHGALRQEAGLRLETLAAMQTGGESGTVLLPGQPDDSLLMQRIVAPESERMPPAEEGAALQPGEIEIIARWIREGAPAPPDETLPPSPTAHWAFQPIIAPEIPSSGGGNSESSYPIDRLLSAAQHSRGLLAQPVARRETRLRRLYLDLIGLPPTRAQLEDSRPWDEIVDELLGSPQHAERWARHWMDVWRYSDWYGLNDQLRNSAKHLWRWRDWIVNSLHRDKPYDRMIHEMLAGDELAPEDPDVVVATGFLARNYYLFNRTTWLDDTIEHSAKAFMGLTLNCAKCHDHKYDPLSQVDYYRFRAIFEPHQVRLDPVPGAIDFSIDGLPRVFDDHLDEATYVHLKGDPKQPDQSTRIAAGVPEIFASFAPPAVAVSLPPYAWAPGIRAFAQSDRIAAAEGRVTAAQGELAALDTDAAAKDQAEHERARRIAEKKLHAREADLRALRATCEADSAQYDPAARVAADLNKSSHQAAQYQAEAECANAAWEYEQRLADGGDKLKAAEERLKNAQAKLAALTENETHYASLRASEKLLETPEHKEPEYSPVYPNSSTGRRLALAQWLTSPEHPLTARVAVNHIWLRHMGQPLVENVFDFGLRTPRPPLAELLDYLAAQLIQSGWSQRHLHRLIVSSHAYQLESSSRSADQATLAADPANHYYWRAHPRRMESQVIRDSLLYLAGNLDLTLGGPSVDVDKPSNRRGIYLKHSRDHQEKVHGVFDDADHLQCYRRVESIVPQQALALANSRLALESADHIADRLSAEIFSAAGDEAEIVDWSPFVNAAFETVLGRPPRDAEATACREFTLEQQSLIAGENPASQRKRISARLIHVLINHNDFLTIR